MPKSTTPPPPPTGGSSTYVGLGVVMLLIMGGLVWWKMGSSSEAPPPPPPPKQKKVEPVIAEAPPPPPEEPKDAGPEAAPEKKVVQRTGGGGPCSGTCNGTATPQLRSALGGKARQAKHCYERALRLNSTLQGKLMVAVKVGPQGQVCSASVTQNTLGDSGIASCVSQIFRAATFPAPKGGCVQTQVPLNFVPKT